MGRQRRGEQAGRDRETADGRPVLGGQRRQGVHRDFFSALHGGELLPATLLDEMRTPHGPLGYGLGLFVQDLGPDGGGTVYHHNGDAPGGYGALMYSTPDGGKTLTAGLTTGDAAVDPAQAFPEALDSLVKEVFGGGRPRPDPGRQPVPAKRTAPSSPSPAAPREPLAGQGVPQLARGDPDPAVVRQPVGDPAHAEVAEAQGVGLGIQRVRAPAVAVDVSGALLAEQAAFAVRADHRRTSSAVATRRSRAASRSRTVVAAIPWSRWARSMPRSASARGR
ncbi:hypothetical protein [Streptomyces subrutilus]|uniref:Uncharacterized protein n=1 Tax=Streptomyces subrutilus TaxID=36818 RepID=A0A1E5PZM5_9ACTN|nr:hypothetical protein [Streptomyces subrutilus]OEJ34997.1 hypothetical protein BGK67_30015 [Streptomyces subrutilus]